MGHDLTRTDATQRSSTVGTWISRWTIPALIFGLALLLRLAPLHLYVTPDEPAWVYRSMRFDQALSAGDFGAVPVTGHPGVTTMWLGKLGLGIHRWLSPDQTAARLDWLDGLAGLSPQSPTAFRHLAFLLPAGRVLVALATSLGLVGVFILAGRLWGRQVALLGALLLALDPFLVGHSGLLHLDGLLTLAMTLSALAALLAVCSPVPKKDHLPGATANALAGQGKPIQAYAWITLSGLLAGLAVLTKTPGGFMAVFVGSLLVAAWLTGRLSLRQSIVALALWALAAGLTLLALYPALWAAPVDTLRSLLQVGERHVEGAIRPIFFRGQITYDPAATFYAVVWLFRASPLVLIGLPLALIAHLRRPGARRFTIIALVALALGFGLFVTLVGKKHDRYLLPAIPPLTLVAALGWEEFGKFGFRQLGNRGSGKRSRIPYPSLILVAVILIQFVVTRPYLSTPLGYFNPLLGGPKAALNWLEVSWGEGLGATARWLNQDADAEGFLVSALSIPPFASFFAGQTVPFNAKTLDQADYIVYPPLQGLDQLALDTETHPPIYDHQVGGISYASVVRNPAPDEQAAYLNARAREGDLILLDAAAALANSYDGPAELVVLADARDQAEVTARLNALIPDHERLWYVALPAASPITAQHIQGQLACYGLPDSAETIANTTISQIDLNGTPNSQACKTVPNPQSSIHFGSLALIDQVLPGNPIAWPDHLPIVVRWEALDQLPADYRIILHLKDAAGHIWVDGGQEILDADFRRPSAWTPGEWSDQTFQLALPPPIPPGRYTVALGVFDPHSGRGLSAWDANGGFAGLSLDLGQVTIDRPPHPPTPWHMVVAERQEPPLQAGPLRLLGQNLPPTRIASGDQVSFDLFWQTTEAPGSDYVLRWRLSSANEENALEGTVPLSPYPTSQWRAEELIQARYDLPIAPDLPVGDYALTVNVLDAGGAPLWGQDIVVAQVEIFARDRLFSLPSNIGYPLDLSLGSAVHIRGFDFDTDVLPAAPSDRLSLTLYWQAGGPTDLSYTVFVHLVGSDGMLYGQVDRPPVHGAAPTHSWAPDQVIIDEFSLPILGDTPAGVYHIAVGLYDPDSGERLPVYDAAGTELLNGQIVLPIEVTVK